MNGSFERNLEPGRLVGEHLSTSGDVNIQLTQFYKTHGIFYCIVKILKIQGL